MNPTSPARYTLRLALVMTAFAAVFAVIAIPRLKAEAPNPIGPIDRSIDKWRPPPVLSKKDEPRFQAALECFNRADSPTIKECLLQSLK